MRHVLKTLGLLSSQAALEACGFELPVAQDSSLPSPPATDSSPFLRDDHLADLMGDFALSLAFHRVVSACTCCGVGHSGWLGFLAQNSWPPPPSMGSRQTCKLFGELKQQPQVLHIKNLIARSAFNHTSVQQYVEAATQSLYVSYAMSTWGFGIDACSCYQLELAYVAYVGRVPPAACVHARGACMQYIRSRQAQTHCANNGQHAFTCSYHASQHVHTNKPFPQYCRNRAATQQCSEP